MRLPYSLDDDAGGCDDFGVSVVLIDDRNAALGDGSDNAAGTPAGRSSRSGRGVRRSAHLRSRHELTRVHQQGTVRHLNLIHFHVEMSIEIIRF